MTGSKSRFDLSGLARVRLAGFAGAAAMVLLLWLVAGQLFAEPLFDRYQRWAPRVIDATRVHVVLIDAASLARIGPWPWPRAYLTQLTRRLHEAGAAVVAYDIIFQEKDPSDPARFVQVFPGLSAAARAEIAALPAPDEDFGSALWEGRSVVARAGVLAGSLEANGLDRAKAASLRTDAHFVPDLPPGPPTYPLAVANVEPVEFNAQGQGLINGEPDPDGITRRYLLAGRVAGRATPGFALDLVRVAEQRADITVERRGERLTALAVGSHGIPVASDGRARLYFGPIQPRNESAAADIIDPTATLPDLKGKLVVVGPASVGMGDVRTTPLGSTEFGVRIHALAADAILSGVWLDRPLWALPAEWALGVILALAAIFGFPALRGYAVVLVPVVIAGLVAAASWGAFAAARLLLDPTRPLLIGGAALLAVAAAVFVATGRSARHLREAALAQQGEMKAARDIQRAMLPDRSAFARLDPRLDLDALIEPAQLIGGDLYDAFPLPDGRIVFLVGDVTGKGTPAALFMAVSKALAHSLLRQDAAVSLAAVIGALNDELAIDSVVEVTMLCGIIDPATGHVELVNAGHENPWLVRAGGGIAELAMEGGLPLCTVPGYDYPLEHATLAPGDGLVVITDGVREAQDAAGGFFGSDRTREVLSGWGAAEVARVVTGRLAAAVRKFEAGTPPSDDLTVMALRWRG